MRSLNIIQKLLILIISTIIIFATFFSPFIFQSTNSLPQYRENAGSNHGFSVENPVSDNFYFDTRELFTVTRVIDGDTFTAKKNNKFFTVRMKGIDTPETVHPNKPVEYYGKEASDFTKKLLNGQRVYLDCGDLNSRDMDHYGRLLAYVFRQSDGIFVNLELVRLGYASVYRRFPCKYRGLLDKYEYQAQKQGLGLWNRDGDY